MIFTRVIFSAAALALWSAAPATAAPVPAGAALGIDGPDLVQQVARHYRPPAGRPGVRPSPGFRPPVTGVRPGYRPPIAGVRPPGYRPPVAGVRPPGYRPPGYRPPGYRPPGYRPPGYWAGPGYWNGWYRPYRWAPGGAIAAGAAIGFLGAAAAATYYSSPPPAPGLCWYYTDPSRTRGFWDACP